MWAITSYFNPVSYRRRLTNYRAFRRHLGVPLVAVEASFGGPFELRAGDADILVQLHGGDVMWQKERLLNIALAQVPDSCEHIAWLDADVVFPNGRWHHDACDLLRRFPMVHLFQSAFDLPPDFPATGDASSRQPAGQSVVHLVNKLGQRHLLTPEHYRQSRRTAFRTGMAWAARADFVRRHGFYDACVIGGGDRAWHAMAAGDPRLAVEHCHMNARWSEHYLRWAEPACEELRGRAGCLAGDVHHLWHGSEENRKTLERYEDLARFGFDPRRDIALDADGCWKWNSDKAEMHDLLRAYFAGRHEDEELCAVDA
jgi:hypothetical protein